MDERYQVVRTVHPRAAGSGVDFHEFRLTAEGAGALVVTYQPRFVEGIWVLDNCFEEVPLDGDGDGDGEPSGPGSITGSGLGAAASSSSSSSFRWCAVDHISLAENAGRDAFEKSAEGNGRIADRAWDYVHFNSVDKTPSGEYLVSARHLDTIFAVSPADGSILWRLGGTRSSFRLDDGLTFARQHDARFVDSRGNSSLTLSLFNNANDGAGLQGNPSRALIVRLEMETMTAHRAAEYGDVPPAADELRRGYISSNGMGNLQLLPGSHVLNSFGRHGAMAEYAAPGGPPLFYADFTAPPALPPASRWFAGNYRAYLLPAASAAAAADAAQAWTGRPAERPALWSYARTPTNLQTFYVSWNGDTLAQTYRFWVSDSKGTAPPPVDAFLLAGTWPKSGFETNFTIGSARPWSFAEALGADGTSLASSSVVRTYVPAAEDAKRCGKWHCFPDVTMLAAAELVPLDDAAALAGDKKVGGLDRPGALDWVEHIFALLGLGFLAWWVWMKFRRRSPDKGGYSPVEKEEGAGSVAI